MSKTLWKTIRANTQKDLGLHQQGLLDVHKRLTKLERANEKAKAEPGLSPEELKLLLKLVTIMGNDISEAKDPHLEIMLSARLSAKRFDLVGDGGLSPLEAVRVLERGGPVLSEPLAEDEHESAHNWALLDYLKCRLQEMLG